MIPNKQIGWSQEENLLWQISKQLDRMDSILCTGPCPTTTTTTVCNCREVVLKEQIYDYYSCTGIHYVCGEGQSCKNPTIDCIDISLPYSGVVPSETVTANCNCNPV